MASVKRKANRRKKIVKRIMDSMGPSTCANQSYLPTKINLSEEHRPIIDIDEVNNTLVKIALMKIGDDWFEWQESPLERMMREPIKIVNPYLPSKLKGIVL